MSIDRLSHKYIEIEQEWFKHCQDIAYKYIFVTDQAPIKLEAIKPISINEFNLQHNFQYVNTLKFADHLDIKNYQEQCQKILQENPSIPQYSLQELQQQDAQTVQNIVIANMGKFGVGAFARNTIPKDSILVYWGEILNTQPQHNIYVFDLGYSLSHSLDAMQFSGLARFLQHAPDPDSIICKNLEHTQIATRNFSTKSVYIKDLNSLIVIFVATRDIHPQEILTINYDWGYWLRDVNMQIFSHVGEPLYKQHYSFNTIILWLPHYKKITLTQPTINYDKNLVVYHPDNKEIIHILPHEKQSLHTGGIVPCKILWQKDAAETLDFLQQRLNDALKKINLTLIDVSCKLELAQIHLNLIFKEDLPNKKEIISHINTNVLTSTLLQLDSLWLIANIHDYELDNLSEGFTGFGNTLLLDNQNDFAILLEIPYGPRKYAGNKKLKRYNIPLHNKHSDDWVKKIPVSPTTKKISKQALKQLNIILGIQFLISDVIELQART